MGSTQKDAGIASDPIVHQDDGHDGGSSGGHDDSSGGGHDDGHDHDVVVIEGTNHSDTITTGGGPQEITVSNGQDSVAAGGGPDVIDLGNGKDTLNAQGGPDDASGGNAKDVIEGGCGPDHLVGGNAKDIIIGGKAADILTGGRGPDVFVYTSTSDAPARGGDHGDDHGDTHDGGTGGGGHDDGCSAPGGETITDFVPNIDRIDFRQLAPLGFATEPKENAVWVEDADGGAIVMIDTNGIIEGDHPAEMAILLEGVDATAVDADCFLL